MTDGWEDFPEETRTIRELAAYAEELFPGQVEWQISDQLYAFRVTGARPHVWVALDQWILVEVGRRHVELMYGEEGIAQARDILREAHQRRR